MVTPELLISNVKYTMWMLELIPTLPSGGRPNNLEMDALQGNPECRRRTANGRRTEVAITFPVSSIAPGHPDGAIFARHIDAMIPIT